MTLWQDGPSGWHCDTHNIRGGPLHSCEGCKEDKIKEPLLIQIDKLESHLTAICLMLGVTDISEAIKIIEGFLHDKDESGRPGDGS